MIKYRKYISKLLFLVFSGIILLLGGYTLYQLSNVKQYIFEQSSFLLESAVRKNIEQKSKGTYFFNVYEYNPERRKRIGEYETRIATYADTTFTFQRKIYEPEEDIFQARQTILVDIGQLHADSIQLIFDSLLVDRDIHAESIIGITASFLTRLNDWSNDTTAININCRAGFLNQGDYEDINYYAYIHYSPYTLWKLMPKTFISILFACSIIMGIVLLWWLRKREKEKREGISLLKDGKYRMLNIIYSIQDKMLISEKEETKLSQQLHELFLLFLKAEGHKIRKNELRKRLWSDNIDSISNMTSTVNRVNKVLKKADCLYTIISDPKDKEFYVLTLQVHQK
jgi:hypothetical protein